jgi:integrase/recombinase XerD
MAVRVERLLPLAARRRHHPPRAGQAQAVEGGEAACQALDEVALRGILSFRPEDYPQWRVQTAVATIIDTGCRIDEVLSSRVRDLDLANTLLTVIGKGDKQRIVPFSFELRKRLVRFGQVKAQQEVPGEWMFPARDGGKWHQRNALRSYYLLLKRLGLPRSGFHLLRHSFATQYLKARGDVVRLSRVLRHSGIGTTMRYVHLVTTDLQAPHQRLSILNRLR